MLQPSESSEAMPAPPDERPVGDLVQELVENGKAYAKAEIAVAKAVATSKAKAFKLPVILFGAALLLLQAGVNVLGVGGLLGLAPMLGPILAGLIVFLLFAGIAGACAWFGVTKLREDL